METLETIVFEGETIRICPDEEGYEVQEGILRGNNYSIEVFPPIGDSDYDPHNRNYVLEYRGTRIKIEDSDLLVAQPIVIPKAKFESRKLTKEWPDIDKEWVDNVAERIIAQSNDDVLAIHLFANLGPDELVCFCRKSITSFSYSETLGDFELRKHLRHRGLCAI